MPKKTPPFKHYPEWTEARFWSFVRSALRQAWNRYPVKYKVLLNNRITVQGKRHKYEYTCELCKTDKLLQKEISVDHKKPIGTLRKYSDLGNFVKRLFCGVEDLQILCQKCHRTKTNEERKASRKS